MPTIAACRSTQHCAVHGFCHRCAPSLAEAAKHVVKALSAAGIADRDQGRAYAQVVAVLLDGQQDVPICGDRLLDWACTLPAGPHPDWHHRTSDGNWWTQVRCPADCGQPSTEHDCTPEPS